MVLKEIADFGIMVACRFYGRYQETGPRFYHPPCCGSDRWDADAACENGRRRASARRSGLAMATLLVLAGVSAPNFSQVELSRILTEFSHLLRPRVEVLIDYVLPSVLRRNLRCYCRMMVFVARFSDKFEYSKVFVYCGFKRFHRGEELVAYRTDYVRRPSSCATGRM